MTTTKMCSKCGRMGSWDSYFRHYICDCGNMYCDGTSDGENFQKSAQAAVRDEVADWEAYKKWCEENGENPSSTRVLCHYVENVLSNKREKKED